jgi:hypothetical protein
VPERGGERETRGEEEEDGNPEGVGVSDGDLEVRGDTDTERVAVVEFVAKGEDE